MVHATPAVQDGLAFIAGCDAMLPRDPHRRRQGVYQIESGAYTGASPVIDGDRAYFGTFDNEVLALDLKRAHGALALLPIPIASSRSTRRPRSPTAASSSAAATSWSTRIDATTGKAAWTFATRARVDSSPVVAGGRVYVGSSDGRLYVLDAAIGQEALGVRRRRGAHRLARRRRRPRRHRHRRTAASTCWGESAIRRAEALASASSSEL